MISMFVFLTVVIYAANYRASNFYLQGLVVSLFVWGPFWTTVAVIVSELVWLRDLLVCAACAGQAILYVGIFSISMLVHSDKKSNAELTDSYVKGSLLREIALSLCFKIVQAASGLYSRTLWLSCIREG